MKIWIYRINTTQNIMINVKFLLKTLLIVGLNRWDIVCQTRDNCLFLRWKIWGLHFIAFYLQRSNWHLIVNFSHLVHSFSVLQFSLQLDAQLEVRCWKVAMFTFTNFTDCCISAFKLYILSANAFAGNQTIDLAIASAFSTTWARAKQQMQY